MSNNKIKKIDIKNRAYYFFDDLINIKNFNLNKIKIDENHTKILSFITLVIRHQIV